jgi:hypothetical protein
MAIGTRNAVYYREIEMPIDINHKVESYEYTAKWRFEFTPAGGVIDENPINVEYNEFPDFVFMIEESGELSTEYTDGIPYGLRKAEEMTLTINLESLKGYWSIVRNFITSETLNLGTSPATIRFNQWKIWRQKLDGTYKLYFWGCQTGMGGYPEWGLEGTKTYEIKAMDVFRAISGKVTIQQLIGDIIDNSTMTVSDTLYQNYSTMQVFQSERAKHFAAGSAYYSLTVRQIFAEIIDSLNARAKWPLSTTYDIFSYDYEMPFITLYEQNEGAADLGAAIDLLDCHRICYYSNDGGSFDGLFYNEKGWQKYPTVWDLLNATAKGLFSKLDYVFDQNNNVKMAFFNCMAIIDYDRTIPENAPTSIDNGFIKSDKLKQRSKIFGASIAHNMAVNEKDLASLVLNNDSYVMISESQEEEMEFNINKSFCTKNDANNCFEFNTLPIFGLFYLVGSGFDKLCLIHDYCEIDSGYSAHVKPTSISDITNYSEINDIDAYNNYIYSRQQKAGISYVWALANNLAFSGQNQAVIPMMQKILSDTDFINIGQKYTYDINAKFGLENFSQFKDKIIIIKKTLKLFKLENEFEILIRGDI